MNTLIHANIFFFITSIAVIVVGVMLTIALVYIVSILGDIKRVTRQVRDEVTLMQHYFKEIRNATKMDEAPIEKIISFFSSFTPGAKKKKAKSKRSATHG